MSNPESVIGKALYRTALDNDLPDSDRQAVLDALAVVERLDAEGRRPESTRELAKLFNEDGSNSPTGDLANYFD